MTAPLLGPRGDTELLVMSFNVRRDLGRFTWRRADRWTTRRDRVAELLRTERPQLLGVQEAMLGQAAVIGSALGAAYRFVGHGRRPGPRGEGCPLFYDAEQLELLSWRQRALSDRPDVPGSTSWTALLPRVMVEAQFRDRGTGETLTAVNTHLDAFSAHARLRQAQALRGALPAPAERVIVMGDLNAPAGSAPWRALMDERLLRDAWTAAASHATPEWRTFAGYRRPRRGHRIDGILVSPDILVRSVGVDARMHDGGWPSDHLPVLALLDASSRGAARGEAS
ncbi:endonuclease/exonuclease/phosphatase family protein [Microbacterium sp. p3-SID336]|uniref:endonuclease/exonuclease/phosphatase family protein n=1 Tax=Microbacterium sp. p3-SID336 TaxID=2916212 RepID=UPI0021A95756|nr:endonuclease/exonuclease/phosphatase family protein [Microbacterium sp. p3-SID336]MCT1479131.1 endonuclease/exonuclease/phosphatase family protein [Microbacterium sp. p3-SID336]